MATVKIYTDEATADDLPRVCIVCGELADVSRRRAFSWRPGWTLIFLFCGLLLYLIVALVTTRRATVEVPLCFRHTRH